MQCKHCYVDANLYSIHKTFSGMTTSMHQCIDWNKFTWLTATNERVQTAKIVESKEEELGINLEDFKQYEADFRMLEMIVSIKIESL